MKAVFPSHSEAKEAFAGCRALVSRLCRAIPRKAACTHTINSQHGHSTLLRFLRLALHSWMESTDADACIAFQAAAREMAEAVMHMVGGRCELPEVFTALVDQQHKQRAQSLWSRCYKLLEGDRQGVEASYLARQEEQLRDADMQRREKQYRQTLQREVATIHNALQPAGKPCSASLLAIKRVVHSDSPKTVDEQAVWAAFQWVRKLYSAFEGFFC